MKKTLLFIVMLVLGSSIFAQETRLTGKERRAAQKAEQLEKSRNLIESGAWQFNANMMLPTSGRSRSLTSSYRVVVNNHEVNSYLPYFGRAYRADFGSTNSPLSFKGEILDLKVNVWKKGGWILSFTTSNKNDRIEFTFYISETGSASLTINSTDRQPISFNGDLAEIESKE